MLIKEDVSDVEYSSHTRVFGLDGDGTTECTEQDYIDRHKDMQYITVNTPLSYAIACNIPYSSDDIEFNDRLRQRVMTAAVSSMLHMESIIILNILYGIL